jgi:hypothetical protein
MTNRFARAYEKIRVRLGGRRKLALTIVAIWIAAELIAAAAVAVAGKHWLDADPAPVEATSAGAALSFSAARSSPSIRVF